MFIRKKLIITTFIAICVSLFSQLNIKALSGGDFQPGNIIDDSLFFDGTTMSVTEIQNFLNSKVPVCDTNGVQPYAGTSRGQYGTSRGYPPPYTCLRDYSQTTVSKSAEGGLCNGHSAGLKGAAQIIFEVAQSCGISPKVLLVLLQKEQSLVTDDWPWSIQYRSATGYGCPDTAPCDAEYYGFFNQLYNAARQYKRYVRDSYLFNYRAGRVNNILYNPNSGCGSSGVYIENNATAALYNYTPYQPNSAALNNLYGLGDGCSSYGNRNFWRLYNDWFGTTSGSYLLRSYDNATVYLIVDSMKHPITNIDSMNALYPLGQVKFVSQSYLDQKITGNPVGRLIRAQNGTVYFFDAGIKLPFGSCELIDHYGLSCSNYVDLSDIQLQKFANGPLMTSLIGTNGGKIFNIVNSHKKEVFDQQALVENNISDSVNVLNESSLDHLPYGTPVKRDNTVAISRLSGVACLMQNSQCTGLTGSMLTQSWVNNIPRVSIDEQSYQLLGSAGSLNGFIKNAAGNHYLLTQGGKSAISSPGEWFNEFMLVNDNFLSSLPNSSEPINNRLIKSYSGATVYYIEGQSKRPIGSWEDLERLRVTPFAINTLSDTTVNSIPTGFHKIGSGGLVKYSSNPTVYMIDGSSSKIPVSSFAYSTNLGASATVKVVPDNDLNYYATSTDLLSVKVTCNGKNYLASGGTLYEVPISLQAQYGFVYQTLNSITCDNLLISTIILGRYILTPGGTIYYVENGQKRPFNSWDSYISSGGSAVNTTAITEHSADQLPTGSSM